MTPRSRGSRSLEGSSTLDRLSLEGPFLFMYSNLFTSGSISTLRVTERFFVEFFNFLFDNMSWCYLVYAHCGCIWLRVVLSVYCAHLLLIRTLIS